MNCIILLFAFLTFFVTSLFGGIDPFQIQDLEEHPSDSIVKIQRIEIPGHPHAFNPSIVRWQGALLMSFREVIEPCFSLGASSGESAISLVWLDDNFQPSSPVYRLDFGTPLSHAEDPRLILVGGELYIIYGDNTDEVLTVCGFRMWMAKIAFEEGTFTLYDTQRLSYFEGQQPWRREKNWSPFDFRGTLCLIYSISPHRIFLPLEGTETCFTIGESSVPFRWKWGELRGGTPAVELADRYLSFFHSSVDMPTVHSQGENILHYFIGAYTFNKFPPFEIAEISPRPLIATGFYSGEVYTPYWKPVRAVFPCGILMENNRIWMTYGRQDHEIWIAEFDKAKLLKSLSPTKERKRYTSWCAANAGCTD